MDTYAKPALPQCLRSAEKQSDPLDISDLAARLETEGVTDAVALKEFGFSSTLQMAETWFPRVLTYGPPVQSAVAPKRWAREYLAAMTFALPLFTAWVSTLWLGFALWGGQLSDEDATAAGLGAVGSFLLSGGVVQAIVRRGLFLLSTQQLSRAQSTMRQWLIIGVLVNGCGTTLLMGACAYWDWLPSRVVLFGGAYSFSLACLWLSAGMLYVKRSLHFAWINVAGIGLVWILYRQLAWPLPIAQLAGIMACTLSALALARDLWMSAESFRWVAISPYEVYSVWPYLLYGVLYYGLLFSDRLLAWTSGTFADTLTVQFRGDYESAVNVGLLLFTVLAGFAHCAMGAFYTTVSSTQKQFRTGQRCSFTQVMLQFYRRSVSLLLLLGVVFGALTVFGATALGLFNAGAAWAIAGWSLPGFLLLVLGLWNVNLLFGTAGAVRAVVAAGLGCLVNVGVGYLASRIAGYPYAALGFFAGGVTFAATSTWSVLSVFRKLDYRYFAAGA